MKEISVINGVFFVFIIIGCVYQVLDISYLYFSYKTNVNVSLEKERLIQIPALSVCTNVSQTIRANYLMDRFPGAVNKSTSKWALTKLLHQLPLREQLLMATVSPDQLFNTCLVMRPIGFEDRITEDYIDCRNISHIRQYVTESEKCFTVLSQLNGESDDHFLVDHDISVRDNGFLLFQISLKDRYLKDLYVNFHSSWRPLEGIYSGQSPFIQVYNDKYSGYSFTYKKSTTQLLSAPYETNCFNYSLKGYKSHSDCIVVCKAQHFQRRFIRWHPYIPASEDIQDWIYLGEESIVSNKTFDKLMSDTCAEMCGKNDNCFNEYFDIKIVEKWKTGEKAKTGEKLFEILVYLPTGMTIKYRHCPRLQVSEYLCYLASILNLWFGISIITCSKFMFHVYYYFTKHKRNDNRRDSSGHRKYYCFC